MHLVGTLCTLFTAGNIPGQVVGNDHQDKGDEEQGRPHKVGCTRHKVAQWGVNRVEQKSTCSMAVMDLLFNTDDYYQIL